MPGAIDIDPRSIDHSLEIISRVLELARGR
jgi:hypothetical protein